MTREQRLWRNKGVGQQEGYQRSSQQGLLDSRAGRDRRAGQYVPWCLPGAGLALSILGKMAGGSNAETQALLTPQRAQDLRPRGF